jgi:DNA-binding Lrp family transcriptional regulator
LILSRLLVFVNIFVESPLLDDVVQALSKLPNVEELYEVTGESDVVALVSAADFGALPFARRYATNLSNALYRSSL